MSFYEGNDGGPGTDRQEYRAGVFRKAMVVGLVPLGSGLLRSGLLIPASAGGGDESVRIRISRPNVPVMALLARTGIHGSISPRG
jgi:hypothetical protein